MFKKLEPSGVPASVSNSSLQRTEEYYFYNCLTNFNSAEVTGGLIMGVRKLFSCNDLTDREEG